MQALARSAKAAGIAVVPTMYLWENLWNPPQGELVENRPEMKYVPQPWITGWKNQITGRLNVNTQNNLTAPVLEAMLARRRELLRILQTEGVRILMGTDSPQMLNVPGFALHRELKVMEQSGLTPYQVLVSGTRNVSEYVANVLRKPAPFGTIAVGMEADLVLLNANPLTSVDNLNQRAGVMVRGRWLPASELEAGLAAIAARNAAP
jgi:hypothetical protein